MLYTGDKLSSTIFWCLSVCEASVSPDQISTFSNIYRHTSPLLTMYHLISSSTNLYWPSTSQYRHILTQYHQIPLIIHHLMSHAQYTWSSLDLCLHSLNINVQLTMSRPCSGLWTIKSDRWQGSSVDHGHVHKRSFHSVLFTAHRASGRG